ncbi:hypothetical protein MRX96_026781 [Rhipicephalus microplus]
MCRLQNNYGKVRQHLNACVEQAMQSRIKDLLPPGSVDDFTALVLVNAIYFSGLGKCPFDTECTHRSNFHFDKKAKTEVGMHDVPHGERTSMVVFLPGNVDGLSKLEDNLTGGKIANLLRDLKDRSDAS